MTVRRDQPSRTRPFHVPGWVAFVSFVAIAAFFVWTEHRAHLLGALPYLLVLLALVIAVLMHRGRGDAGGSGSDEGPPPADDGAGSLR